jgi:hypothetical protein
MIYPKPNLDEALASLARLRPHLPAPRLTEYMNCCGISLPDITAGNGNLPVIERPEALVGDLSTFPGKLPQPWMAAWNHHKDRLRRNAQWRHSHEDISEAQIRDQDQFIPSDMDDLDGVVAGLLLLACRPMPSPVREKLISRTKTHWWGAYWAAHGIVFRDEAGAMLNGIANDPRLAAHLWLANQDLAGPLVPLAMERNDLWSAIIALAQPFADLWLGRVCLQAEHHAFSALTAVVLQPTAAASAQWVQRLQSAHPRLAYLAVRCARYTWSSNWQSLRDQLREAACRDRGLVWFHWHRDVDIEPGCISTALHETDVDVLWQAELVAFLGDDGLALKRRLMADHPNALEARLALKWLQRRPRPHP